jgi:hypothetical protein
MVTDFVVHDSVQPRTKTASRVLSPVMNKTPNQGHEDILNQVCGVCRLETSFATRLVDQRTKEFDQPSPSCCVVLSRSFNNRAGIGSPDVLLRHV